MDNFSSESPPHQTPESRHFPANVIMADEKNGYEDAESATDKSSTIGGFASTADALREAFTFELNDESVVKMLSRGKSVERCQFKVNAFNIL